MFNVAAAEVSERLAVLSENDEVNINVPGLRSERKAFLPGSVVLTVSVFDALVTNDEPLVPIVLADVRVIFGDVKPTRAMGAVSVRNPEPAESIRVTIAVPALICSPTLIPVLLEIVIGVFWVVIAPPSRLI
jgi:hypothetical protein